MQLRTENARVLVMAGFITLGLLLAGNEATGQPPRARLRQVGKANVVVQNLPSGVAPEMARKLMANEPNAGKAEDDAERSEDEGTIRRVETSLAQERAALKPILEAAPFYRQYREQAMAIMNDTKLNDSERGAALTALEAKYRPQYLKAVGQAGIRIAAVREKVRSISPDLEFTDNFTVVRRPKMVPQAVRPGSGSNITTVNLSKPFSMESDDLSRDGITFAIGSQADANAKSGLCFASVSVADGVGAGNGKASVGHVIEVPAGVKRIEVTAQADRSYNIFALSVAAVSGAKAKGALEINGVDGRVAAHQQTFGTVLAPLFWHSAKEGDADPIVFFAAANIPPQGGTFQINLKVSAEVWTGGVAGGAYARVRGTCKNLQVRFIR